MKLRSLLGLQNKVGMLLLTIAVAAGVTCVSGCNKSSAPTRSDLQAVAAKQRQTAMDFKAYQINHGNLSAEEKQRLLQRLQSTGP